MEREICFKLAKQSFDGLESLVDAIDCKSVEKLVGMFLNHYDKIIKFTKKLRFDGASCHIYAERDGKVLDELVLPLDHKPAADAPQCDMRAVLDQKSYTRLSLITESTNARDCGQVMQSAISMGIAAFEFLAKYKDNPEIEFYYLIKKDATEKKLLVSFEKI